MGNMHECSGASMRLALMCRSKAQLCHMLAPEQPLCQTLCRSAACWFSAFRYDQRMISGTI